MSKEIIEVQSKQTGLTQSWEEKLEKYAVEAKEFVDSVEEPGMRFFSTKDKILKWDDAPIKSNILICVVLTHCFENALYKNDFKSDDKASPSCFSLGVDGETLAPHANAEEPANKTCKDCPKSEWGSGTGKAKACANKYRLATLPAGYYIPDENPELILEPKEYDKNKIGYLRIPPTSLVNYTKYVKLLRSKNLPPFAMFTQIELLTEGHKITFKPIKPIKDIKILEALELRVKEAEKEILTPYEKIEVEEDNKKPLKY